MPTLRARARRSLDSVVREARCDRRRSCELARPPPPASEADEPPGARAVRSIRLFAAARKACRDLREMTSEGAAHDAIASLYRRLVPRAMRTHTRFTAADLAGGAEHAV